MNASSVPTLSTAREALFEACIVESNSNNNQWKIRFVSALPSGKRLVSAKNAVLGYRPMLGDRILVARSQSEPNSEQWFLVGVIHTVPLETQVFTACGTSVALDHEKIVIRDTQDKIVVVYDAESKSAQVSVSHGKLNLQAGEELSLEAPIIRICGQVTTFDSEQLQMNAKHVETTAQTWELTATKIVHQVQDMFQEVQGLLQTRTQRARMLVKRSLEFFSNSTAIQSKENTQIDGKRVLLG
jgi:hypothetical protein